MSVESDAIYYSRREAEERAAGAEATDPMIADIHFVMAERYADRIEGTGAPVSDGRTRCREMVE